jgi:hypothetical protein
MSLEDVYSKYGIPDNSVVSYVDKNGVSLAYVSHAHITKTLCEIDPLWSWEPVLGVDGLPAIRIQHGEIRRRDKPPLLVEMATMWGKLTLLGVTRWAVGSVEAHKPDLDKELVSDFLRNAAMRFGIALSLWMKDGTSHNEPANNAPARSNDDRPVTITNKIPGKCRKCYTAVAAGEGIATKADGKWITYHRDGECPVDDSEEPF